MIQTHSFVKLSNGQAIDRGLVPDLPFAEFREAILDGVAEGWRVASLFGHAPVATGGSPAACRATGEPPVATAPIELYAVLADAGDGLLQVTRTRLEGDTYPSLTPECPQVHTFEREIAEQYGIKPVGHPWFKPVRYVRSWWPDHDAWDRPRQAPLLPGVTEFYRVEGDEIHEVGVGPIHAGVIEPGHFRFQCHGETVYHLEVSLGYQHRGVERALIGGPNKRSIHYAETLAGDTTVGHATAYCQALEGLAGTQAALRGQALRGIALELERLANHTGDLGALAGDVGFLPTQNYCGRLRGEFLNATALICGSRFGRGLVRPGGAGFDVDAERVRQLTTRLAKALEETQGAVKLLWTTQSVLARFEQTCPVTRDDAVAAGFVGMVARSCGLDQDVRQDFPAGIFRFAQIPVSTCHTGDVFARAYLRWLEIQRSGEFLASQLKSLPAGPVRVEVGPLRPNALVVTLVEGWRGEICHTALTDDQGLFERYKVVDPSFHNWFAMMLALRGQQISDFPLCNKSMNLSYCGHDL